MLRISFLLILAISLGIAARSQTVANANIKFHTTDNDKDHDTHVTVEVTDGNGIVIARIDNDFGHFNDNSDSGPFDIPIVNPSNKGDVQRGSVKVHIDPNGHDTWDF